MKALFEQEALLYCWSSGGGDYARTVAAELGIESCFAGFLPKPNVVIDDQEIKNWRRLTQIHPGRCGGQSVKSYWRAVQGFEKE